MEDLTKLVDDEIIDRLAAVDGVADVELYGDQEKVFRVDLTQAALASRGLTVPDVSNALASAALDVPAGSLKSATQDIVVRATAMGADTAIGRTAYASAELFESVTRRYGKPDWRLETIDIDGKPVRNTTTMLNVIAGIAPGTQTTFRFLREGRELDLPITVGKRPTNNR